MNKRHFRIAISIAAQVLLSGFAQAATLTHGPVVGGVDHSSANVFLRTDQAANLAVRYGSDPNLAGFQVSATSLTSADSDFTKIIGLTGLPAETTIYLNPIVNGVPQLSAPPYPSFKTFPLPGSSRSFNLVVLTDFANTANLTESVGTYANAAAKNPVLLFIGGDFDHRNPKTLPQKRGMFRDLWNANTPHLEDFVNLLVKKTPIVHQWDDHDAGLNNLDKTYPDWNLTQQAFQEYVPSYPLPAVTPGIWQKFSYAQLDGFVLDCRSQRDSEFDTDDANKSMLDGNALGPAGQLEWLKTGLLTSTARWKVIFTSVSVNPTTKFPDGWAGYTTEWNALRDFIDSNHITGVVFISGDLHVGAIDNGTEAGFPEMCVAPPGGEPLAGRCAITSPGTWSEGFFDTCATYGLVSVSDAQNSLTLQVVDQFGTPQITYTMAGAPPTPTPTPTATPTPTPTATPTPTVSPTPTPTSTPSPTSTPTPTPTLTTLGNISTRLSVQTGDNVLIGGFIITGTQPKKVLLRAIGPSLATANPPVAGALADTVLELHEPGGTVVTNDNWKDTQKAQIIATTLPPINDLESAILATLDPGAYTAIVKGKNGGIGVGLVEAYDLDGTVDSKLANISTRGLVQTGDNVMIGGFIILGDAAQKVLVRAIGPSLPVAGALADPVLELHDKNGATIAANDNWKSSQKAAIIATTLSPTEDAESAILATLSPGAYTTIVRGANGTTGVALAEVYALGTP